MIQLTRKRTTADVPAKFRDPGRIGTEETLLVARLDHLRRRQLNPTATHGYKSTWWRSAKATLRAEAQRKCAYCEGGAAAVAHCDVEHIRPKDHWWWLTCCWDNYCFSCQICNQSGKGTKFPTMGPKMSAPVNVTHGMTPAAVKAMAGRLGPNPMDAAAVARFATAARREKPGLLDPYLDDPAEYFAWRVEPVTKMVFIEPRSNAREVRRRVADSIDLCDLNRDGLCELRFGVYMLAYYARMVLFLPNSTAADKAQARATLKDLITPKQIFAGMCRHFICDIWRLEPRP